MTPIVIGRGSLLAVAPTPIDGTRQIHFSAVRHLIELLSDSTLTGVAVGTPLGRGTRLTPENLNRLLNLWREGLAAGQILIASAGAAPDIRRPAEIIDAAAAMARRAAGQGADVLVVEPPGAVRGRPERDRLVLEYHSAVAEAGLPLVISYRREASGGIAYTPDVLAQLLARREVIGVEIATIDGIAMFQQVESLARELAPEKHVISGEERFLGYSLMCGATAALVGIAAAYPAVVGELLEFYFKPDPGRFLEKSATVNALARPIFRPPLEGSTLRLLRALAASGTIPTEAVHDPWGPSAERVSTRVTP